MKDLHAAFDAWLSNDARDELPRDVALHASACPDCLRAASALDALALVDLDAAALPPLLAAASGDLRRPGLLRAATATVAVLLVVAGGIVAGGLLLPSPTRPGIAVASPTPTPAGAVLGGQGGPQASGTAEATTSPAATEQRESQSPSAIGANPTPFGGTAPNPTMGGGPPLVSPTNPPLAPQPTATQGVEPPPSTPGSTPPPAPVPTPTPTPVPTPPPTPVPTPTPTPTPTPQCSDGIDNDGDLLIDFGSDLLVNDPGCLSPGDDDEFLP